MSDSSFDLVVFGATSFVGKILARYLLDNYPPGGDLSWAIAGRSEQKLNDLKNQLGSDAEGLDILLADAGNEADLNELCSKAEVIISTVGPYALYGEALVKACADNGTDYCDLTGEVQWMSQMIERYHDKARQSGARIVHTCGFDSIPSDMGVWHLQKAAKETLGSPASSIKMRVKAAKGGLSGGTVASMINLVKEAKADPKLRKLITNPYALCPTGHSYSARQPNVSGAEFDRDFKRWLAPFIMAGVNTRVVHRSNALLNDAYGTDFTYDEAMIVKSKGIAKMITRGLGAFTIGAAFSASRWFLESFVVPKPGQGPSPKEQETGFFDIRFRGTTEDGKTLLTKVTGDRDPGYGSTAKMLAEAAICLAKDTPKDDVAGGCLTPSTAFGDRLIPRLVDKAGLTFEIVEH